MIVGEDKAAPADRTARLVAITSAGAPVSFTALSPPEQGDALFGLTLAVAGVGHAVAPNLPVASWPTEVGPADAWAAAVGSETGWYVLLSQDCDVVRDSADEPTVWVAPLGLVDQAEWNDLARNGYSSRRFAYPGQKFEGVPDGKGLAVDLAWTTSVLKGSLRAVSVRTVRPLTGPNKRWFAEWLAARVGRAPFPDDVVTAVLDPCYDVRRRLSASFDRAAAKGGTAPLEARAVAAVERWFAHRDGRLVTILGQLTGRRLVAAGFIDPGTGAVLADDLARGMSKLESEVVRRMNKVGPTSGYQVRVTLADLARVPANQFIEFALLVR